MALQGSTLSSLLCCIYLAHLETEHLLPLLPQAAWHSSCTSAASSVAPRVTDLALAAGEEQHCPREQVDMLRALAWVHQTCTHKLLAACNLRAQPPNLPPLGFHLQQQASLHVHTCSHFPLHCRQPQRHLRTGAHAS